MIDIQALTRAALHIEPLPASVTRLAALAGRDSWNVSDVEQVVRLDQALTLRLLRAANSAASASAMQIVTIRDAVIRLGLQAVITLATAVGVQKRLVQPVPEYGLDEGALWRHSVAAALAAESAQPFCTTRLPPEAYAAALLHDVGKLVMGRFLEPDVLRVLAEAREQGGLVGRRAESELLLVHHGELGGLIAQHWGLADRLVTGIIHHHTPELAGDVIADAVYVANIAAKHAGTGHPPTEEDIVRPDSLERLGMTAEGFHAHCVVVTEQLDRVLAIYAG